MIEITAPTVEKAERALTSAVKKTWSAAGSLENAKNRHIDTLKASAVATVELRSFFFHNGAIDWSGKHNQDYREAQARAYTAAGVPADSMSGVQASIRYHVGNLLREVLTGEELDAAGLDRLSPREKAAQTREAAKAAKAAGIVDTATTKVDMVLSGTKTTQAIGIDGQQSERSFIRFDLDKLADYMPVEERNLTLMSLSLDSLHLAEKSLTTTDPVVLRLVTQAAADTHSMVTKLVALIQAANNRPEHTVVDISNNVPAEASA